MKLEICEALPNQFNLIESLARKIWPVAYGDILSADQIVYMLDLLYSMEKLNRDAADGQKFLLARLDAPIGFAAIQHGLREYATKIHKIYLLPEFQGRGFGRQMMDHITQLAKEERSSTLILNVNRNNPALHFYRQLGFKQTQSVNIDIGNGYLMEDHVMEKSI